MEPTHCSWTLRWTGRTTASGLLSLLLLCSVVAWGSRDRAGVPAGPLPPSAHALHDRVSTDSAPPRAGTGGVTTTVLSWQIAPPTETPAAPAAPDAIDGVYLAPPVATAIPAAPVLAVISLSAEQQQWCAPGHPAIILRQVTAPVFGTAGCESGTAAVRAGSSM